MRRGRGRPRGRSPQPNHNYTLPTIGRRARFSKVYPDRHPGRSQGRGIAPRAVRLGKGGWHDASRHGGSTLGLHVRRAGMGPAGVPQRRRDRPPRRRRRRQGRPAGRHARPGGLHHPRGRAAPAGPTVCHRCARGRRAPAAAHRAAVRHVGQHVGRPRHGAQRGGQVLQPAAARRGHHPGRLRHRGAGRPVRAGGLPAVRGTAAQPQAGWLDGPVRRARRLSGRHAPTSPARRSWSPTPMVATPAA